MLQGTFKLNGKASRRSKEGTICIVRLGLRPPRVTPLRLEHKVTKAHIKGSQQRRTIRLGDPEDDIGKDKVGKGAKELNGKEKFGGSRVFKSDSQGFC